MDLKSLWERFVEFAACLMALGAGLLSVAVPLAPLIGIQVNGPMILVVPFAWGIGLPFLALGLALWPARLATARVAARLAARYPKLARLNTGGWVGGIVLCGFAMVMISVAFLYERAPGSPWENFWMLLVVAAMFLLIAVLIASPILRDYVGDAMFYVISALVVSAFAAVMTLAAAGRATGGRMEIVEPVLWAVCVVLVVLAGATWRNVWREFRSRR